MKRTLLTTLSLCAALAVSANLALAQTDNKPAKTKGKAPSGKLVKGEDLIGSKLYNKQGEHIGEMNDIVFDENKGTMTHGMLAVGGWLGLGEKIVPVPWKFIKQSEKDTEGYVVDVEKSKLTPDMAFDAKSWPNLTEGWYKETYSRFSVPSGGNAKLVRGTTAIGAELFNQQGEDIGEIQNLLVHPNTGKVAYATCEIDRYATGGEKLTNIPWTLIRQSKKDTEGFVVNVDKTKLTNAKYFGANSWPDFNADGWHNGVYSYYDTDPFWQDGRVY